MGKDAILIVKLHDQVLNRIHEEILCRDETEMSLLCKKRALMAIRTEINDGIEIRIRR